jgi:hypothetical protein
MLSFKEVINLKAMQYNTPLPELAMLSIPLLYAEQKYMGCEYSAIKIAGKQII